MKEAGAPQEQSSSGRGRAAYTSYETAAEERKLSLPQSHMMCTCRSSAKNLVAMRLWETPVPIPNTTVKTGTADGTVLETVWESRWLPDI